MTPSPVHQILCIEDSPGEAILVKKSLMRHGYEVTVAHTGQEGISACRTGIPFSAVLVDLKLPDMSGLDVLEVFVKKNPLLPVIVVTGRGDEQTAVTAMKLGANDYIVKDVSNGFIELIPSVIEQAVSKHQLVLEKQRAEEIAQRREAILESVAFAAQKLLQTPTWSGFINDILARLGNASQVNRIYLIENKKFSANGQIIKGCYEWSSKGVASRTLGWAGMRYEEVGLDQWIPKFKEGSLAADLTRNLPDKLQEKFQQHQVVSTVVVPIFTGPAWWGVIGLDCCLGERVWDASEVDALRIAANILGAALQRQKTEATLYQAQKLESIGLLAGGVAHDFNNLLAGILGQTTISLFKLPPDSPARTNLNQAIQTTEQAALLVQQLLGFAGKGNYEIQPINLNSVIQDNLSLLETIMQKRAVLTLNLMPKLPAVEADMSQIQQVLMNLVINASEATENNQGKIWINTRVVESEMNIPGMANHDLPPGRYVCLEVTDNGRGIEPSILNQIFDPFFSTKAAGRGLGLSAAMGIVQAHGGTLQVESVVGETSNFRILLPASDNTAVLPKKNLPVEGRIDCCLLLIDDERAVREAVKDGLEEMGAVILTAENGQTGIDLYRQHYKTIDLILLDMQMPGMNGRQTFQHLREINPQVKVVFSSGYSEMEMIQSFSDKDRVRFLKKPYRLEKLTATVREVIQEP